MQMFLWIVVALMAPPMFGPDQGAGQVLEMLDTMERAVLAGDAGAYMAQVQTADRKFMTEQRAWFADLNRNPVSEFRIEPLGGFDSGFNGINGRMKVVVYWTLEADGIERSLEFDAEFAPVGTPPNAMWRYEGRYWYGVRLGKPRGLRVYADLSHKELATGVLDVVPGIQNGIERELGLTLSEPLTVKIYPTVQELQYSVALGYINMLSGWNEPGESIKILGRDDVSAERISSLLAHEIGHAVSFEYGPEILTAPWWSLEGIAELVADEYRLTSADDRIVGIARQVERGDRRSWEQLSDFKGEAVNHSMYVYSQGWSMVRYITNRYGKRARNKWFAEMGQGASVEDATLKVLGVSFGDLDMEWESEMISIARQAEDQP